MNTFNKIMGVVVTIVISIIVNNKIQKINKAEYISLTDIANIAMMTIHDM